MGFGCKTYETLNSTSSQNPPTQSKYPKTIPTTQTIERVQNCINHAILFSIPLVITIALGYIGYLVHLVFLGYTHPTQSTQSTQSTQPTQ